MDFTYGTQVSVPGTRQKCHHPSHMKILDDYDDFNNYVVVGSFRDTTNFGSLDVRRHMMTFEASREVSSFSHNNNNTTILLNLFVQYLQKSYKKLLS